MIKPILQSTKTCVLLLPTVINGQIITAEAYHFLGLIRKDKQHSSERATLHIPIAFSFRGCFLIKDIHTLERRATKCMPK